MEQWLVRDMELHLFVSSKKPFGFKYMAGMGMLEVFVALLA